MEIFSDILIAFVVIGYGILSAWIYVKYERKSKLIGSMVPHLKELVELKSKIKSEKDRKHKLYSWFLTKTKEEELC